MEVVTIDGMDEQDFRYSIEDMLRSDQVDAAVERLRALLKPCVGIHETLPPRFLEVSSRDVEFGGWHRLADRLCDYDRPNHPVSAIGVILADARVLGGPGPSRGRLAPFIKTFYFNDDAYPFSDATRDDLLDGYSRDGFEWQGDYQATDATLSIKGIDDLYGAIVELEDRLLDSADPGEEEIRAGTIGACYLATLIHQSLRETIREKGLPRPLCVLAACDGVYPFFDAPVAGSDETMARQATEPTGNEARPEVLEGDSPEVGDELAEELPGMASLLSLVSHKVAKAPVMVLCEEDAEEALRFAELAEAQRVGVEDGHALNVALAETQAAMRAEVLAIGGEAAWGDTDVLDPPALDDDEQYRSGWIDDAEVGVCDFPNSSNLFADHIVDGAAAGAESTVEHFVIPASHSLRARIMLTTDSKDTSRSAAGSFFDWFRRTLFRR